MRPERARILFVSLAVAVASSSASTEARADDAEDGRRLYAEAYEHFVAGRCREALPLLERSNQSLPSPNSGLLIARCLADIGSPVEASERYAAVEHAALAAVRQGEAKYAETAAAAAKEGAKVRARLGWVRVRITNATAASVVTIDDRSISMRAGESIVVHAQGQARVAFVKGEQRRDRTVEVTAGKETLITFDAYEPPPAGAVLGSEGKPSEGTLPVWSPYATGGLSVVGLGSFVGFGLAAESEYAAASERCGGTCTASDVDAGKTYQTVANIGLVAGLVFATATALVVVLR